MMKLTFFITKCSFQETGHLKMTHFYPLSMLKDLPDRKLFRQPKITTGITRSNISSRWNKLIAITTWNSVTYIGHFHRNFWHFNSILAHLSAFKIIWGVNSGNSASWRNYLRAFTVHHIFLQKRHCSIDSMPSSQLSRYFSTYNTAMMLWWYGFLDIYRSKSLSAAKNQFE